MAKKAENREEKSKAPAEIKYLSVDALADLIQRANAEGGRFCFVLGSGASVESGIPDGKKLEMDWMNCLMGEEKTRTPRHVIPERSRSGRGACKATAG